eukprot:1249405-Amphidinium_carterae.2
MDACKNACGMSAEANRHWLVNPTEISSPLVCYNREIKCVVDDSRPCQSLRFVSQARGDTYAADHVLNEIGTNNVAAYAAICFERMLEMEQELEGDVFVIYRSYNGATLLYEVQAEIARRLCDLPKNIVPIPCIREKDFADKSVPGLKAMLGRGQDHATNYREIGLCL